MASRFFLVLYAQSVRHGHENISPSREMYKSSA